MAAGSGVLSRLPPRLALVAALRFYLQQPGQLVFSIVGLALGVAVIIAIDLATDSAARAVEASARLLGGDTTHQILPARRTLDEAVYARLRREAGVADALPVVEGRVLVAGAPGSWLPLIGTDVVGVFARSGDDRRTATGVRGAMAELLTEPGAVLVTAEAAAALGVAVDDELLLAYPRPEYRLRVSGVLPRSGPGTAGSYLLADIATAQEALGLSGRLSRIDLRLDAAAAARIGALAAPDWRLTGLDETVAGFESLTRSFRLNLRALSLLALLLGAFLIYSTVVVAVLRRRPLYAVLRSVGVTRGQILALVLAETLLLAGIAVVLGALLGGLLGAGLVSLVLQTLDDLYFSLSVDYYRIGPTALLKGMLLGFGASLAAAALPALEAVAGQPRGLGGAAGLEHRALRLARGCALAALPGAAAGAAVLYFTDMLAAALAGMFLVLVAAGLLVPALTCWVFHGLAALAGAADRTPIAWAARSIAARLSRTGPALAALVLAVASFIAIGLMIHGLRASVASWLDFSLDADLYFTLDGGLPEGLDADALLAALAGLDPVEGVSASRRVPLPDGVGFARLLAAEADAGRARWPLVRGDPAARGRWQADPDSVLVSEAWARKQRMRTGDRLTLQTPAGPRTLTIAGIFVDYSTEAGVVAMHLARYRQLYGDPELSSIGLFAAPGQRDRLRAAAADFAAAHPPLRVAEAQLLRDWTLQIFDRTFTVTRALQLIAGLVAFIAMLNGLRALQLDAGRELAVLHALGMDRRGMLRLCRIQHLLLGTFAALLAVPLGLLLAVLLTGVITPIAFGWSTDFVIDAGLLAEAAALALAAALLAGLRVPLPGDPPRLLEAA